MDLLNDMWPPGVAVSSRSLKVALRPSFDQELYLFFWEDVRSQTLTCVAAGHFLADESTDRFSAPHPSASAFDVLVSRIKRVIADFEPAIVLDGTTVNIVCREAGDLQSVDGANANADPAFQKFIVWLIDLAANGCEPQVFRQLLLATRAVIDSD